MACSFLLLTLSVWAFQQVPEFDGSCILCNDLSPKENDDWCESLPLLDFVSYEKKASYQSFMSFACLCVLVKVNMELGFVFLCELSPVELSSVSAFLVSVSVKHYNVEFWLLWLVNQVTIS